MVSYYHNTLTSMYQKNHTNNLTYGAPHWYPSNYPPPPSTAHHTTNGQYLPATGNGNLIGPGMIDSDAAALAYYNQHSHLHPHHHHPMFHQSSPDWTAHDNYGPPQNSAISPLAIASAAAATNSSATNNLPQSNSQTNEVDGNENDNNNSNNNMHLNSLTMGSHVPPSPPNTVNSGCSQMSSPTMPNNSGGGGNNAFNDSSSPHNTNAALRSANSKSPYEWMKKATYQALPAPGKTRTKDKYRVVYTDYQRLELEKEFHTSRYITIRRKTDIAQSLLLSERQVKIWFQNRRAKDRKQTKKRTGNGNDEPQYAYEPSYAPSNSFPLAHFHSGGYDVKPKIEAGLLPTQYGLHNMHHHHHHQLNLNHAMHPMASMASMASMSTMGAMGTMGTMGTMGLHNSIASYQHAQQQKHAPTPSPGVNDESNNATTTADM